MDEPEESRHPFDRLVDLMQILRGPEGCPWDREQTRETLKPLLIEEAYELLEALGSDDPDRLCEELGDLLFQVIFHCQMSSEAGEFDAHDVCRRVYRKMVHRHPHVFGDVKIDTAVELLRNWEDLKAEEKRRSGQESSKISLLEGIPEDLPALYQTYQLTAKAARVGFDWPDIEGIRDKFLEEFDELKEALAEGTDARVREEVGDLVFAALNIARYLEIDPETSLRGANRKFTERFQRMERVFRAQGRPLKEVPLEEMEAVWQGQKKEEEGARKEGVK